MLNHAKGNPNIKIKRVIMFLFIVVVIYAIIKVPMQNSMLVFNNEWIKCKKFTKAKDKLNARVYLG